MRGTLRVALPAAALIAATAGAALGSGFNIYEAGARATALGGAFTATADDGSAVFYNPAGIAFLEGTVLDLNLMPVVPDARFTGAEPPAPAVTGQTVSQSFPIPGVYLTHTTPRGLAFGLGVYAPFGLGVEWEDPATWVGRQSSYDVDLATIYVTPVVAWRISERTAVSIGADVAWCDIELNRYSAIEYGPQATLVNVIDSSLDGTSDLHVSPTCGVLVKPLDELSLGFMYHGEKTLNFDDGDATLSNVAPEGLRDAIAAQIAALGGPDHKISTDLRLPAFFSLGVAYQLLPRARLEFDAVRFNWSHFDRLELRFDNPLLDQTIEEQYKDIWQLRLGLDLDVAPRWKAMFGYIHDNTPQPTASISPLLPDADREDFSCGLQWRGDGWRLTASYMAVLFHDRSNVVDGDVVRFEDTQPAGSYDSVANIFGFGVGHDF